MSGEKKSILKTQQSFRSKTHNVFTEKVNKIALSASDDKKKQIRDGVISDPFSADAGTVCKAEWIEHAKKENLI